MKPVAEIFSQGDEVVRGQIVDRNAAWLSERLTEMGFDVTRHTAVGDRLGDLAALVREISERADCCICTGGLGPTSDDLTAEAVGIAAELRLQFDAEAFERIRAYFAGRGRAMPDINRKQAMLPETSIRIDNAVGTAPGFALRIKRCWFVFLPGVPSEMAAMFDGLVESQLRQRFELYPDSLVTLRTVGMGESAIQQCLEGLALPASVQLGFRATADDVQTKLLFPAGFDEARKRAIVERAAASIGDAVFAIDGLDGRQGDLVTVIDRLMRKKSLKLATLETASQGLIAAKCLGLSWLKAAEIVLDIERTAGADMAETLAGKLKSRCRTDLALVQIHQAFSGDNEDAVVLYNALDTPDGSLSTQITIAGTAKRKQNQAALLALDLLRRYLQDKCHYSA